MPVKSLQSLAISVSLSLPASAAAFAADNLKESGILLREGT